MVPRRRACACCYLAHPWLCSRPCLFVAPAVQLTGWEQVPSKAGALSGSLPPWQLGLVGEKTQVRLPHGTLTFSRSPKGTGPGLRGPDVCMANGCCTPGLSSVQRKASRGGLWSGKSDGSGRGAGQQNQTREERAVCEGQLALGPVSARSAGWRQSWEGKGCCGFSGSKEGARSRSAI